MRRSALLGTLGLLICLVVAVVLIRSSWAQDSDQDFPTVYDDLSGPDVGPEPSGKLVPLAPLTIPDEMRRANAEIVSDDFNDCSLDTDTWQFIDPEGDSTMQMVGTFTKDAWLSISVPAAVEHLIWLEGNNTPRVMQSVSDTDFEIEVKFESGLDQKFQQQGIVVEQDEENFLRFEFFSNVTDTFIYAGYFEPAIAPGPPLTVTKKLKQTIADAGEEPLWMRLAREGERWTLYYSLNGNAWQEAKSFRHDVKVSSVGLYAANSEGDGTIPGHTALVDYFFNTSSPIDPEDGARGAEITTDVEPEGAGTVGLTPEGPYDCDEEVTLTPNASAGYAFDSWGGTNGDEVTEQPDGTWSITMDGHKEVTAKFIEAGVVLTMLQPIPAEGGTVTPAVGPHNYNEDEIVTLVATPNAGWSFVGWFEADGQTPQSDVADYRASSTTIEMDGAKEVRARFLQGFWIYTPIVLQSY